MQTKENVPDCIMKVAAWVLGEFGDSPSNDLNSVMDLLSKSLFKTFEDTSTKGWILTALQKLSKGVPNDSFRELISRFSTSRNEDLQQRCYELAGTCTKLSAALNFKSNLAPSLGFQFLESYVQQQLLNGAKPYNNDSNRRSLSYLLNKGRPEEYKASEALQAMRVEPYQAPVNERTVVRSLDKNPDAPELQVKNKVWSNKGYLGNTVVKEPEPPVIQSYSRKTPVISVNSQPKPSLPRSEKELAKEALANTLFGTFSPQEIPKPVFQSKPSPIPQKKQESLIDL